MTPTQLVQSEEILRRLASGEPLRRICDSDPALPPKSTWLGWLDNDPEMRDRYARARAEGWERMAEEIVAISDDTSCDDINTEAGVKANNEWIQRSKLRVDTRKWLLSKMLPKVYGDKQAVEVSGPDGGAIQTEAIVVSVDPVAASQAYQQFMDPK